MSEGRSTRLNNIITVILIVLILAMIALQVWHMLDSNRPVIRPHIIPTKPPALPGAWYEKYRNEETCNLYVTS